MILFILGLVIGSIGGIIMMALFLTGKNRDASFDERTRMHSPSDTVKTGSENGSPENRYH